MSARRPIRPCPTDSLEGCCLHVPDAATWWRRQILLGDWERDGRTMEMFEDGEAELWWAGKQMEQVTGP